jgi:hypothetical protein
VRRGAVISITRRYLGPLAAAALAVTALAGGAGGGLRGLPAAAPAYHWYKAAIDGGGFTNVVAVDPLKAGHLMVAGDDWGEYDSSDAGATWTPRMGGATGPKDIWGKGIAYSLKYPGTAYVCTGQLGTLSGGFAAVTSGSYMLDMRSRTYNCGTTANARGVHPRPVGQLIQVDYDRTSGVEYIYVASSAGVARSTDGGHTFTVLGLAATPLHAFSSVNLMGSNSLYVATWWGGGHSVFRLDNIRGAATTTQLTAAPAFVQDITTINGVTYAAAGPGGVYTVTNNGATWTQISGGSLSGSTVTSIVGSGTTLFAGAASPAPGTGHTIARSTDGGHSWTWVSTAAALSNTIVGTSRSWWLGAAYSRILPTGDNFDVSQLASDPHSPGTVYVAGRSGVWRTTDNGAHWAPAVNRLDGTIANHVKATGPGSSQNDDVDWGGEHNRWLRHRSSVRHLQHRLCGADDTRGGGGAHVQRGDVAAPRYHRGRCQRGRQLLPRRRRGGHGCVGGT